MENVKITPQLVQSDITADGIQQDETFEVEFLFEDLVTESNLNPLGVVLAGYTDVLFNPNLVLLAEEGIAYGDGYLIQQTGENRVSGNDQQVGRISEVGAATSDLNAPQSQAVFTLTFIAQDDLTVNPATIESEKPDEPTNITVIASSDDDQTRNTEYGELTIGPDVNIIESDGSTHVSEDGETDTYELVLNSQPSADVTINVSNVGQVTLEPTSVTFTPENWDTPQEVTVTAADDNFEEGNHDTPITHSIADGSADEYLTVGIDNVVANITDNDEPITEEDPEFDQDEFTFDLNPDEPDQFSETVTATDPNDDPLTYSITDGNDPDGNGTDAFAIDEATGEITVADAAELAGQTVFNLTVVASDGELTDEADVTINVGEQTEFSLDVDGGSVGGDATNANTDGILIFRYLQNTPAFLLTNGNVLGENPQRTTGQEIADFLSNAESEFLDVDGGSVGGDATNANTDGILIFRYLQNTPAFLLTNGNVLGEDPQRATGQEIADFLDGFDIA